MKGHKPTELANNKTANKKKSEKKIKEKIALIQLR